MRGCILELSRGGFSSDAAGVFVPYFRYLGHWKQAHSDIEMGQKVRGLHTGSYLSIESS